MKKLFALLLAGTLTFSMSMVAFAAENDQTTGEEGSGGGSNTEGSSDNNGGDNNNEGEDNKEETPAAPSESSSTADEKKKPSPTAAEIQAAIEKAEAEAAAKADAVVSEANALAAEEMGISMATINAAVAAGKSVGEFNNNAVTETPGLEETTPVAQGGGVIIDGTPSNQSFTISKPVLAQVDSAKAQAAALNGTILNVVDVDGAVFFENASVNFYLPGVTGTENIQVLQLADGQWAPVAVKEVRADHVVVDMTDYGVLAFVQVQ